MKSKIRLTGLLLLSLLASACVATEPATPTRGYVVAGPPPPQEAEQPPPSPSQQAIWVAGYWHWTGAQYNWIVGHWERPPPGMTWAQPRYSSQDGAHYYEPGRWNKGPAAPNGTARAIH